MLGSCPRPMWLARVPTKAPRVIERFGLDPKVWTAVPTKLTQLIEHPGLVPDPDAQPVVPAKVTRPIESLGLESFMSVKNETNETSYELLL